MPTALPLLRASALMALILAGSVAPGDEAAAEDAAQAARDKLLRTFVDELVEITPGRGKFPRSFIMGSADGPPSERPPHEVRFDDDFAIGRYEVPQNLYEAVMGHNPSRWRGTRNAAEMMTWQEANTFCTRLTGLLRAAKLIAENQVIRLPSEAEWEYCCRAGTRTAYSFGDEATAAGDTGPRASRLDAYAWHTGNAAGNDPAVGVLKPNAWGLYDMHGYLWEYVADAWHPDYTAAPTDGRPWDADARHVPRVMRGGSWRDRHDLLRCTTRWSIPDHTRSDAIGFRCVRVKGQGARVKGRKASK